MDAQPQVGQKVPRRAGVQVRPPRALDRHPLLLQRRGQLIGPPGGAGEYGDIAEAVAGARPGGGAAGVVRQQADPADQAFDLADDEQRLAKEKIAGDEFRVIKLDGDMVPWKELEDKLEEFEEKPNEFKNLIAHLKKRSLKIAFGIRQGYLLVGVGESLDHVGQFVGGALAGHGELVQAAAEHAHHQRQRREQQADEQRELPVQPH